MSKNFFKQIIIASCIFPISLLAITGCTNDQVKIIYDSVDSSYRDLNIKVNDSIYEKNSTLYINIEYISNYYLMDESNELITSYLFSNLGSILNKYNSVIIETMFYKLSDVKVSVYKPDAVKRMQNRFTSNQLFKDAFCYFIKNSNSNEILGFNEIINDFEVYLPEKNLYKGNFWNLIENYTINYKDSTSNDYLSVKLLYEAAKYPKLKLHPEVIKTFMEMCENRN
jgi:hypothetical protein